MKAIISNSLFPVFLVFLFLGIYPNVSLCGDVNKQDQGISEEQEKVANVAEVCEEESDARKENKEVGQNNVVDDQEEIDIDDIDDVIDDIDIDEVDHVINETYPEGFWKKMMLRQKISLWFALFKQKIRGFGEGATFHLNRNKGSYAAILAAILAVTGGYYCLISSKE
jgi:hypothetical protein